MWLEFWTGKPVHPDHLRMIESIVNEQINAELDVFSKEASLADAKSINGLRAVFGEVSRNSFMIILYCLFFTIPFPEVLVDFTVLQNAFHLICRFIQTQSGLYLLVGKWRISWLIQEKKNGYQFLQNFVEVKVLLHIYVSSWSLSIIILLMLILWTYSGTHITNTREAKAFALLSEKGIAKGIRRITAVTTDVAFKAIELALSLEQEVDDASKTEGSSLEKVGTETYLWMCKSFKSCVIFFWL